MPFCFLPADPTLTTSTSRLQNSLAQVRTIVRAHGGDVRLTSSAEATTVELVLPAAGIPS
ncbi:MAG: hypothetical protein QM778_16580 [Myxococcales bacterium]